MNTVNGTLQKEKTKVRICVLAGGWSSEREVSVKSGRTVCEGLDQRKYQVDMLDPRDQLERLVQERKEIDLVFNMLHGKVGEDGNMQGFLNVLGIPYIGSGMVSSSLCMNKKIAKELYKAAGLPVARHRIVTREEPVSPEKFIEDIGLPLIIKPVSEGSSIGISICRNESGVREGMAKAFLWDREIMLEEYIQGRELTCCVMGNRQLNTLPLIEIVPNASYAFFDYDAKYKAGASKEICPAEISGKVAEEAAGIAKTAHRVLQCAVWSRSDMIVQNEKIYLLETNTIPGMTETSLFPLAAKAAGLSLGKLLDKLVTFSMEKEEGGGV